MGVNPDIAVGLIGLAFCACTATYWAGHLTGRRRGINEGADLGRTLAHARVNYELRALVTGDSVPELIAADIEKARRERGCR